MDNEERLNKIRSSNNNNNKNKLIQDKQLDIDLFINSNIVINKYCRPWTKLEKKLRLVKLQEFCDNIDDSFNFNDVLKKKLFIKLKSLLDCSYLNKKSQIIYDDKLGEIIEIKALEILDGSFNYKL